MAGRKKVEEQSSTILPDEIESEPVIVPAQIRVIVAHGFIDSWGRHRHWQPSQVVDDPAQIKLLIQRKALIEAID